MAHAHPTFGAHLDNARDDVGTIELGVLRSASQEFIVELRRYLRSRADHAPPGTLKQIRGELIKVWDEFDRNLVAGAPFEDVLEILSRLDEALDALDRYRGIDPSRGDPEGASIVERDEAEGVRVARRRTLLERLDRVWESLR